ncbi:MAG: N-(5'-phosphoribosyl)anthranilate isomerase, partial [Mariprofundaceae bacterium]|nr:N-(5'-phosphoribosyl)anthranilate isomerase [Mariprofundaceae bacterium]
LHGFTHDQALILAGGLNITNVKNALSHRQWFALDVSSGVETAPGIKDYNKMHYFVTAVQAADKGI